jgi:hypothetical protein
MESCPSVILNLTMQRYFVALRCRTEMQKPWRAASLETRVGVTITMSSILGCIDDHNVQVKMKGDLLEAASCISKRS